MESKIITEEKKNILMEMKKDFIPVMTHNKQVFVCDTPVFRDFCELVEADCDTLCRLSELYSGEIAYSKEDGRYITTCLMKKDSCILERLSVKLESEEDFLELFENKDRKEDNHDYKASLKEFFDMSTESVIDWIKENEEEVWEGIKESIISNIDSDELEDSVKEDIAKEWTEDNPCDAVSVAEDYLCCDDMKDIIIRWLSNNF